MTLEVHPSYADICIDGKWHRLKKKHLERWPHLRKYVEHLRL